MLRYSNPQICPTGADVRHGGMKQSGNGREGGKYGIEDFLEAKAIAGWP
nr:aldehyde dehydrogenase family protein [Planktotalea frisia]